MNFIIGFSVFIAYLLVFTTGFPEEYFEWRIIPFFAAFEKKGSRLNI